MSRRKSTRDQRFVDDHRKQTLQELEGQDWGEPTFGSHLVETIHRLRRKPIGEFTVEDLRIVIGQNEGLQFLMPIAIEALERAPLAEGDFYPGDLLQALLRVDPGYWTARPDLVLGMRGILAQVQTILPELEPEDRDSLARALGENATSLRRFQ